MEQELSALIENISDLQKQFYSGVAEAGRKFGINHRISLYLSGLLAGYSSLKNDVASPGLHTRFDDAFVFQIMRAGEETALNLSQRYIRMKAIGDTLLFSVGFVPESVMPTERRERPSLEYYAYKGSEAYSNAAEAKMFRKNYDPYVELMNDLSNDFARYAGVLFDVRKMMPGLPIKKEGVRDAMSALLEKTVRDPQGMEGADCFTDLSRLIIDFRKKDTKKKK